MVTLVLAMLAQVTAQPANTTGPQAIESAKPKVICEYEEEIGSRLAGKRVCHTKEEWAQIRHDAQDSTDAHQRGYDKPQ